jgi:small subunit ribosomal protein S16
MIKIRLRRVGAKKQPYYRVVVADARSPRDGRFIETIGHYNPRTDPPTFHIKEDRAIYWLQRGAQPTDPVLRMLNKLGTLQKLERVKAGELLVDVLAEAAEEPLVAEEVEQPPVPEEIEKPPAPEEEAEALPLSEIAIQELELSARALNALTAAGIETVQDVLSKLEEGREAILAIPGLGGKSLEEIEERLRDQGFLK